MSIQNLKELLPDFAKDIRINLINVLTLEGAAGLTEKQIFGAALSVAFSLKNTLLIKNLKAEASDAILSSEDIKGIKTAVSLMGMNNIYYRTIHLAEDHTLSSLPARLRMMSINNPGIDKTDFEIYSLAVSAIAGCGLCIKSHTKKLIQEGLSVEGVQSVIRIAAVIHGCHQSLSLKTD